MDLKKLGWLLLACLFSVSAQAAYQLDSTQSTLNFISIKKDNIAETHSFKLLSGSIDDAGTANVIIDLISVETTIPIRNERMKSLLLETDSYPTATANVTFDADALAGITQGQSSVLAATLTLELHGHSKEIALDLRVTGIEQGSLLVTPTQPILINAFDFALETGIQQLMEVAKLPSISTAVPVTFSLIFTP
ncbi:MAG: YceI family protein [Cycloclasticus sp.]|nr:YceI family protein [Cycloclasticus sp.]MBQ0790414.1 YceI family protein [Cycloclasticus sp.]